MDAMRYCLIAILAGAWMLSAAESKTEIIEGKLIVHAGAAAVLETAEHQTVELDGDTPTQKVLHDDRLNGMTVHATGHFTAAGKFILDPKHGLLVHTGGGAAKAITYWCKVCSLRSYTPGPCACCGGDTDLDLQDSNGK
jgi:hypothetical protein